MQNVKYYYNFYAIVYHQICEHNEVNVLKKKKSEIPRLFCKNSEKKTIKKLSKERKIKDEHFKNNLNSL